MYKSKSLKGWSKKSFTARRSENDFFESVILESVKIESVCVSAQPPKYYKKNSSFPLCVVFGHVAVN